MAGLHVDVEEEWRVVLLEGTEAGDVLGRFPVHDLGVVEAGLDEHGGVVRRLEVLVGRIAVHVGEVVGLVGVSPLFIFGDGEGERGVEHGVHDVYEGDVGEYDAEELRPHIDYGAEEQTAGAAAFDGDAVWGTVALANESFDDRDEIGEGVELGAHFAGVVPVVAEFAAAADVSVGEDKAAVEEREAGGAEADGKGVTIGAVAIDVERVAMAYSLVAAVDE